MDKINILNPPRLGGSITSRKRAERYVRRGVARWVGGSAIRFLESDHRHVSAIDSAARSQLGYDQVKGLPVCGPAIKCFMLPSKRGNGYGR